MNGVDTLSYLNIATSTVIPFTAVSTPGAPTLNAHNTLTTGAFPLTYRVTANSTVGETAASNALSTSANKDRDNWSGAENVVINFPSAPSGATSWNVYVGVVANSEYLVASNISISATTFTDTGGTAMPADFTRKFPTTDSTAGPKVSRGSVISGRAFMTGDKDNPYFVWFGGDPTFELDFSPAHGGGNVPVGNGTKDLPNSVKSFRDGRGVAQVVVLTTSTNGAGKRFILSYDPVTFNGSTLASFSVTEDNGKDGTESPDGVIFYKDSLWYPSRDGFKTTGTKPQLQNVLTTDRVSNTIQPDMKLLNSAAMPNAVGLGFEGRLYWALPVSADTNNEIWVLDLDRKGAWMKPWSISAQWMTLYNDNTGNTHFLLLSNNVLYDMSYSALTTDDGVAFQTNAQSGQIYFSEDKRMWVKLLQVVIVILRPQGEINFQITGKTEDAALQALGEPTTFIPEAFTTVAGWGEVNPEIVGWGRNAWSKVNLVPTSINDATQEVLIEIDEEIQWAAYGWSTVKVGTDYNISDIIYEFIEIGIKDLT